MIRNIAPFVAIPVWMLISFYAVTNGAVERQRKQSQPEKDLESLTNPKASDAKGSLTSIIRMHIGNTNRTSDLTVSKSGSSGISEASSAHMTGSPTTRSRRQTSSTSPLAIRRM